VANSFKLSSGLVAVGDVVRLHQRIVEGEKERLQVFEGIVIAIKGAEENLMFTVRKISAGGIGVERIYPVHSPWISKIEVKKKGRARRAKLYYLRGKGKKQAAATSGY